MRRFLFLFFILAGKPTFQFIFTGAALELLPPRGQIALRGRGAGDGIGGRERMNGVTVRFTDRNHDEYSRWKLRGSVEGRCEALRHRLSQK